MQSFETRTVGEIALASPAAARVFEEYKIDYSCQGNTPFVEACRLAGAEPRAVELDLIELMEVDAKSDLEVVARLSLGELTRYIFEKHHGYTKRELAQLRELGAHIRNIQPEGYPGLSGVLAIFEDLREHLVPHMLKEEMVLFPYLAELEETVDQGMARRKPHFGSVSNPIGMLKSEHEHTRDLLNQLRSAVDRNMTMAAAPADLHSFYSRLVDLEKDLHQHIHLENNLLFVKAVEMDAKADLLSN